MTNAEIEKELNKGEEMGYFQYGGSTVIAVFPKDAVQWDHDLKTNSEKSLETLVQMGERIGTYTL
jgi:phosphatidylserine decarboxylase